MTFNANMAVSTIISDHTLVDHKVCRDHCFYAVFSFFRNWCFGPHTGPVYTSNNRHSCIRTNVFMCGSFLLGPLRGMTIIAGWGVGWEGLCMDNRCPKNQRNEIMKDLDFVAPEISKKKTI